MHQGYTRPGMSESKSSMSAFWWQFSTYANNLQTQHSTLQNMQKNMLPLKVETTKSFHHLRQKHTVKYNQTTGGDTSSYRCAEPAALHKSKRCLEITDVGTRWKKCGFKQLVEKLDPR